MDFLADQALLELGAGRDKKGQNQKFRLNSKAMELGSPWLDGSNGPRP